MTKKQKAPKIPRPRGRPKNTVYLPYVEAQAFIREQQITSVNEFKKWWEREKPKVIPRFPYRVYEKDWTSWNEFLGSNNKFENSRRSWREFEEACKWVRELKLTKHDDWFEYIANNEIPTDIPKRPDLTYPKWRTWGYWLGHKPQEIIAFKQKELALARAVFFICREPGNLTSPGNIYTFATEPMGLRVLHNRWKREKFEIIKMFWQEDDKREAVQQVIAMHSTGYQGEDRRRLVPNIYDILWRLSTLIIEITNPQKELEAIPEVDNLLLDEPLI